MGIGLVLSVAALDLVGRVQYGPGCVSDNATIVSLACYNDTVPSVQCRALNSDCPSTQMVAHTLSSTNTPGCVGLVWTWTCAPRTLTHCVDNVWCDPRADCNETVKACTCRNNLTQTVDDACECEGGHYISSEDTCLPLTPVCEAPYFEQSAPTATTDRVCVTPAPTAPWDNSNDVDRTWFYVAIALIVVMGLMLVGIGVCCCRWFCNERVLFQK